LAGTQFGGCTWIQKESEDDDTDSTGAGVNFNVLPQRQKMNLKKKKKKFKSPFYSLQTEQPASGISRKGKILDPIRKIGTRKGKIPDPIGI